MKRENRALFIIILMLLVVLGNCVASNANNSELVFEDVEEDSRRTIFNNLELCVIKEPPTKRAIKCFDVDSNGNIAIGSTVLLMERTVCIYDSNGAFLYGFRFKSYGAFGIEINDELLNIYLIRGDFVVTVDREGNLVEIRKIPYSNNSRDYMENTVFAVRKTVGDAEYSVRNDQGPFNLISSTYSRLCVKTTDGSERILYDVNSSQLTLKIIASIVVMSIMVYGILRIVKEFKLLRAKRLESAKKRSTLLKKEDFSEHLKAATAAFSRACLLCGGRRRAWGRSFQKRKWCA